MSKELQDKFNLHKGEKVLFKSISGLLPETISDVVELQKNEFVVHLEGFVGYVDFSDILTLGTVLSMFDIDTRYVYLLYIEGRMNEQINMGIFNTKEHAYSYAKEHLSGEDYYVERWEVK